MDQGLEVVVRSRTTPRCGEVRTCLAATVAAVSFATQLFAQDVPPESRRIRIINGVPVIEGVPASAATATPAPAAPKTEEEKRLADLLKLKFDRSPASILKAQATLAESTVPEDKAAERYQLYVTAGRWKEVGAFLKTQPEKSAVQLYEALLKDLDRVTTPTQQQSYQPVSGPTPSPTLLQEDIADLADLTPIEPSGEQLRLLSALLKRVISANPFLGPLLERLETGTVFLGGKDPHKREQAAQLLLESGRPLEAQKFLLPLEPGKETSSLPRLDRHVACAFNGARQEGANADGIQRAWELNQLLVNAPNCPADLSERAWRRVADIARFLPNEVASKALADAFVQHPERGLKVLRSVAMQVAADRTSRDLSLRKKNLELQQRVAVALLPLAQHRAQWQPALDLFALNWIEEADYSKRLYQPPRRQDQFDEFGNRTFFSNQSSYQYNSNQLPPVPLAEVLPSAPDAVWLATLDPGLRPRALSLIAEGYVKLEEDAKALPLVEQLAPLEPKEGLRLANDLLRAWAATHDPLRGVPQRRSNTIYYSGGMMMGNQQQGIPLTRALQQRNLEDLSALLARLRKLPLKPLDDGAIVQAFTTAHSAAEVYREESIELVLGKDVKPETFAELLQSMRQRLATQWRKPSVQQQAKTQRTDAQIDQEVLRGYELLGSLLEKALARQPDDWRLNLAQAATWFDWAEFQYGKKVDLAIYVEKRERSFAAFQKAAGLYATKLPTLKPLEETPVIYQQWLNANLGASDLAMVTRQQESNAKSLQRIRETILALPGDAAERHLAALAKAVTSSADSLPANLKPAYLRAALSIVGERPESEEIGKLVSYHDGLLREIEASVRLDGNAVVGHGQPFGVFFTVRHTAELERENTGGFSKWLRNQSQNPYFYSPYGIAPVDHRDELEKQMREKLGEGFEIVSIVFHDDKVQSRGYGRPGWRETPLVYLLLKAKDASVDHLPALRLDVDFIDAKGPVVLPVESAVVLLDARPDAAPARPVSELEVTQTLDDRTLGEGKLLVEVKATAKGLVPKFEELFDFAPEGFKIEANEDSGPAVQRLASEGDTLTAASERNWLLKLHADPAAGRAVTFQFPKPKSADLKVTYKRYQDADLVETTPELALAGLPLDRTRFWGWGLAAFAAIGLSAWFLRQRRKVSSRAQAPATYTLPATITPFSILELLRRMHADPHLPLSEPHRAELANALTTIEGYHFSPRQNGTEAPDLDLLGRDWVNRAHGAGQ